MITSEEARKTLIINTKIKGVSIKNQKILNDYITQQEKLTNTVKRYFELKAKGITTEAEALEHRELLSKLYEMAGIEE